MLLQLAGEFCSPSTKKQVWDTAEEYIEPTWDQESGEFYLGLRLGETFARSMECEDDGRLGMWKKDWFKI